MWVAAIGGRGLSLALGISEVSSNLNGSVTLILQVFSHLTVTTLKARKNIFSVILFLFCSLVYFHLNINCPIKSAWFYQLAFAVRKYFSS